MHTQPIPRRAPIATPPPLTIAQCPTCGPLTVSTAHRQDCFPAFQRALLSAYPALTDVVTMEEANAIERIFRFWTGIIHALRRSPAIAEHCVERRWYEVTWYVERVIARHTSRNSAAS